MGSLGLPEIAFIVIIALLIFGPKKLPEIGRTVGRGMAEFRRATDELKRAVNTELALEETPVPPVLRTRRIEDNVVEPPITVPPIPGEAPQLTEPRAAAAFPAAAEPAPVEPAAAPEPVAVPAPDLPEPPR